MAIAREQARCCVEGRGGVHMDIMGKGAGLGFGCFQPPGRADLVEWLGERKKWRQACTSRCKLCLVLLTAAAEAGFQPRRGEFTGETIQEALRTAEREGNKLIVIFTNPKTTCGLARSMFDAVYSEFRSRGTLLFLDTSAGDLAKAPASIQQALRATEAGRFIPKTVVMTPDASQVVAYIPYSRERNERVDSFRDARRKMSAAQRAAPVAAGPRVWRDIYGNTIKGELVTQTPIHVTLRVDGDEMQVERSMFSSADIYFLSTTAEVHAN